MQQPSGHFSFQNVAPGRYTIMARTMTFRGRRRPPGRRGAERAAACGDGVKSSSTARTSRMSSSSCTPASPSPGSWRFSRRRSPRPTDLSRAQVSIFPFMPDNNSDDDDGTAPAGEGRRRRALHDFRRDARQVPDVGGGDRRARAGSSIRSRSAARMGSTSRWRSGADRDVSGVAVTFGDRISELSGTIANAERRAGDRADDPAVSDRSEILDATVRRIRTIRAGADGQYNFRMVPPGEYRLTTLVDPEPGTWFDRELLEQLDFIVDPRRPRRKGEKKVEHVTDSVLSSPRRRSNVCDARLKPRAANTRRLASSQQQIHEPQNQRERDERRPERAARGAAVAGGVGERARRRAPGAAGRRRDRAQQRLVGRRGSGTRPPDRERRARRSRPPVGRLGVRALDADVSSCAASAITVAS